MKNPVIEAKEICRILRVGGASRVSRLKLGDLEVEFNHDQKGTENQAEKVRLNRLTPRVELPLEKSEMLLTSEDEERSREMEEMQVLIDDPVAYEEQVIAEHLGGLSPDGRQEVENSRSE